MALPIEARGGALPRLAYSSPDQGTSMISRLKVRYARIWTIINLSGVLNHTDTTIASLQHAKSAAMTIGSLCVTAIAIETLPALIEMEGNFGRYGAPLRMLPPLSPPSSR
jgi:hypothetical protein